MINEKNTPWVSVYLTQVPDGEPKGYISHVERRGEIEKIKDYALRRDKHFVWRLLELATGRELGKTPEEIGIHRAPTGQWVAEDIYLSLSHSGGALAVALSSHPVGVDIEPIKGPNRIDLAERFFTGAELELLHEKDDSPKAFLEIWCRKEAIFKASGKEAFMPRKLDSTEEEASVGEVTLGGSSYIYAVFGEPCGVTVCEVTLPRC